jgi:hypothetical protein
MTSPELFYESWLEALRDDVRAIGGAKVVGAALWPEKSIDAAKNKLNDALNEERRERLTDEQERWIMRSAREKRGFSAALYHLCDDVGFERPKERDPLDEAAQLQREFISAVQTLKHIEERLERTNLPMRAVK